MKCGVWKMKSVQSAECGKYIKEKDLKNIYVWIYERRKSSAPYHQFFISTENTVELYDRFSNENGMTNGLEGLLIYFKVHQPEFQPSPPLAKSRERDDVSLPRLSERRRRLKFGLALHTLPLIKNICLCISSQLSLQFACLCSDQIYCYKIPWLTYARSLGIW